MRNRPIISFLALVSLWPVACSLAVQSELDDKPTGAGGASQVDAGVQDGPQGGTAGDAAADQQDDVTSEPGEDAGLDGSGEDTSDDAAQDAAEEEAGPCTSCPADRCCDGVCVDTNTDPNNCGACGHVCGASRSCVDSGCSPVGWVQMSSAPTDNERARACAVWAGDRVFIWGGMKIPANTLRGDGLTYDPATDQWDAVATDANTPTPRAEPVCLWTGTKVFVWGGVNPTASTAFANGALWDPNTNSWESLPSGGPTGRARPVALWTGSAVLVWGGIKPSDNHGVKSGALWTESTGAWSAINASTTAPPKNKGLAAAWTGTSALVFGGRDDGGGNVYDTLFAYTPSSDAWSAVAPAGAAPAIRSDAFAALASGHMMVWGGLDKTFGSLGDGARATLALPSSWVELASTDAPSPRAALPFESGWIGMDGTRARIVGGVTGVDTVATDGGTYDIKLDVWTPIPSWGSAPHRYGIGVWTGSEFVVWGGYDGSTPLLDGSRWMP